MSLKRKAPSTPADDAQPNTKRVLRSTKAAAEDVPLSPAKTRRSRRGAAANDATTEVDPTPQDAPVASCTRRVAPHSATTTEIPAQPKPGPSRTRTRARKKPIATTRRGNHAVSEEESGEQPDELLLSPDKKPPSRPITPPRSNVPKQRAILRSLYDVPDIAAEQTDDGEDDEGPPTNAVALEELSNLLRGTVLRGEGNSCLLMGPRGSGKTRIVEKAIAALPERPITIRLSGHAQKNDRLAIREIARQLTQQTGTSFLPSEDENVKDAEDGLDDSENPFLEKQDSADATSVIALPPPAHSLALISMIPTLPRATIVILDAFDQFASHARQSLLYCLLDTAQSCRVGKANKGLAVIGVTARIDTINLLEKRVKSRFSGRMLRTACPRRLRDWTSLAQSILTVSRGMDDDNDEWDTLWTASVDNFLNHPEVKEVFMDNFGLARDVYTLRRILAPAVLELSEDAPFLSPTTFTATAGTQRCPARFPFLSALPYASICLLIAAMHARAAGHESFTFEMLHEAFRDQVEGGSIGMVRCSRDVLVGAFERLVAQRVFLPAAPPSSSIAREFVPHRCAIDRSEVKQAVETMGQTNLKKWLNKMQ
ncbi:hypothetical protein DAEQUDRAFT_740293 [Daedalea quercina L-15889]|uniref:Uncharacterized protein n=1 Tax=Daedalea quercina L-15889 TaxID=1314783 RepID=A0A165MRC9_9APHY|nr:hypothetical protein DAEQUDRAFT_740293 [Daedalea quercina L-15889]